MILLVLPGILSAQTRTQTEDPFDELVKEKKEIFGSEKEEKYPIRLLVYDLESWKGHTSWHLFWFIRSTDYPKFKQFRIFPLYNSIEAKSGKASLDYFFPIAGYRKVESEGLLEKTFVSPLFYNNTIEPVGGGPGYRESTSFYWLGYNFSSSGPGFDKSFTMVPGFFPLFTRKNESLNGVRSNSTLILPLLYFSKESPEESKTTLALFHWGHDLEKKYFHFFPLLHYTNYKTREDYSFTFFPLFHQSKSNIESKKFALYSPLWFQEEEKTSDSYSEFTFLPFPLLYKSKEVSLREESSVFLLAPLALYLKSVGENVRFRNFLLFQWGRERESSFFRVLPLLYWSKTQDQADSQFTFFPFIFYKQNSHFNLFPIVFYKKDSYFTLFPLYHHSYEGENFTQFLPFMYRREGKENSENLIFNTYWSSTKDGLSSFHFMPFWFYKKNEYKHLFPFYFSWLDDDQSVNRAGPLFYQYRSADTTQDYYLNTYYKREKGKGLTELISFPILFYKQDSHFGLLPFYYHSIDREDFTQYYFLPIPMYRHIRKMESETLVLNAYWTRDAKGDYLSSVFFPFYFHKKNSYLNIPLLLYFQSETETTSQKIGPLFYSYSAPNEDEFFLLGYHSYSSDLTSFKRLYPLYYSSQEKNGSSFLGLGGLFYRWKNAAGETTTRTFLPLHYYQKNEYNLWFPFYFRFGGEDKNYLSFSPLHYRLRSPNVDRDWIVLYYSSENREEKTSSRFVAPLYFEWKNAESRGDIFLPAYLKYYEKNKNLELYFGGLSVSQTGGKFDASFKSSTSGKEFYVDLDYSFFYNIFSVSLRKELSNPLTFFSEEKKEEPVTPIPQTNQSSKNTENKKGIRLAVVAEENVSPPKEGSNFASYKKLARENSRNYFGWEALFGIASYQSGDDKSHFRILPLGWFTWGKNNKDRIFAFPLPLPTFWGTVGDESYRVIFPLFAEQRKGEDFTRAFGIFLFVMEQEKDRREYSVLWPLIRYAKSKEETAYRFFPFFTHREAADRLETKSIFYYRSKEKTGAYESSSFHGILFPFYHASEEIFTKNDSVNGSGYGLFFPIYYRNFEDRFTGGVQVFKERNIYTPLFLYSSLEDSFLKSKESFVLSPFFFASSSEKNILEKPYVSDLNLVLPIPFVVWGQEGDEKYSFIAGLYRANSPERSTWNFLLLFGSTNTKTSPKEEIVSSYVFPFYFGTTVKEGEVVKYKSKTIPLLYSGTETPDYSENRYAVFFSHKSNPNAGYSKWVLPPFLYYEEERNPYGQVETSIFSPLWFQKKVSQGQSKLKTSSDKKFYPIPLLATYESITDEGMIRETSGWDWLFFANSETRKTPSIQKNEYDLKILLGGIFGYSSQIDPVRESISWNLSLFYFRKSVVENGVKTYASNFVPILHSSETTLDSEENTWFLIIGSKADRKTGYKRRMFLPVYYEREEVVRKGYTDFTSFYLLFYQWKSVQEGQDGNRYVKRFYPIPLVYTFHNRIRDDKVRKDVWGFDWLFLANYKNTKYLHSGAESTSFKALLSLFGYERNGSPGEQELSSYLFPLFFYKSGEHKEYDSYRWFVPIVAYRSFNEKQGKISSHTNLFGILMNYKRDDDAGTKSFFLFPSIYYSNDSFNKTKTFFVLPFLYSSSSGEDQYSFFLMGYYQSRNQWSNRYNFLYLFDLESSLTEQKRELTLFLGAFNGEFQKDKTRWGVFGGILLGYESTPQKIDWNVLWIRYLNSPQEKIQNFLPVYRYSEDRDSYSLLAPPILTYHEKDSEGSLTLGGLGLLYYKNRSEISKEESTKVLGGLLFFSEKKAARGYQNYGILGAPLIGGLLFNYEYEEDTGFEKSSFLKFVFSRTTYKGKTWNSYFGISSRLFDSDKEDR